MNFLSGALARRSLIKLRSHSLERRRGFTLIELAIVILIMAIIALVAVPRVRLFTPAPCDEFATHFDRLLRFAYVRALTTGKLHRVFFRVQQNSMHVEVEKSVSALGKRIFEAVGAANVPTEYVWNSAVEIRNFFIKKMDENARGSLKEAWLYVFPAGLTQEVIINIEDNQRHTVRGLVVNPFSSQCVVHGTLQKP